MTAPLDLREEEDVNVGAADSREEKSAVAEAVAEDARVCWMSRKGLGAKAWTGDADNMRTY